MAQSIAKVLGATARKDGYLEGNGYLISWCVGHLIELASADRYDPKYSKWSYADLPIMPNEWSFTVSPNTKKQFEVLKKLMADSRVESIVCATDAGREGELIFRLVYNQCKCKKPIQRLWISSMEDSAIKKGFENLLDSSNYDTLYEAALCRAKADWLVGINGTRLFSTLYNKTLNVGRVMTPTLALLVDRESAIGSFKKEKFYNILLDFKTFQATSEKIYDKPSADKIRAIVNGKNATVQKVERKEKCEKPPKLYDLTTLQREANRLHDYTAQQTLDCVQALYEKKLTTYPRTDSRYLTEDMQEHIPRLAQTVMGVLPFMTGLSVTANVAQVIDSSKVSDHHAIIPTMEVAKANISALPTAERNILFLISTRLLSAIDENHIFASTEIIIESGGHAFTAKGKTVLENGFKSIEQAFNDTLKEKPTEDKVISLPEVSKGDVLENATAITKEGTTSPPKHFTEDTLLFAMENAESAEFADIPDLERKGLGTPATRAGVIEKLVKGNFVERKNKQLLPTETGLKLITVMPDVVRSAALTAQWEHGLKQVELGELSADAFMSGITSMVSDLIKSYNGITVGSTMFVENREAVGICPRCGKNVVEIKKGFVCESKECGFAMWRNDIFFTAKHKELTKTVATTILKNGRVKMKDLFSKKKGILYDATVALNDDIPTNGERGKFVKFKLEFEHKNK